MSWRAAHAVARFVLRFCLVIFFPLFFWSSFVVGGGFRFGFCVPFLFSAVSICRSGEVVRLAWTGKERRKQEKREERTERAAKEGGEGSTIIGTRYSSQQPTTRRVWPVPCHLRLGRRNGVAGDGGFTSSHATRLGKLSRRAPPTAMAPLSPLSIHCTIETPPMDKQGEPAADRCDFRCQKDHRCVPPDANQTSCRCQRRQFFKPGNRKQETSKTRILLSSFTRIYPKKN